MAGGSRESADELLIAALVSGATVAEAAKRAKVSPSTAARRLGDPAFKQRLAEARSAVFDGTLRELIGAESEAVKTLRALLKANSETVKLGAARAVLEPGQRWRDSDELERRVIELEQEARTQAGAGGR